MPIYNESVKSGVITNGSTTIKKVYHGSTLVFGKELFSQAFTSSGGITFPATILSLKVTVVGGGGGGGGGGYPANIPTTGCGGGGGGKVVKIYNPAELQAIKGTTVSFTVGTGGAGGAAGGIGWGGNGQNGANSSFLSAVAYGGTGGSGQGGTAAGGTGTGGTVTQGGTATGGGVQTPVVQGGAGHVVSGNTYGRGGNSSGYWTTPGDAGARGCVYVEYTY